MFAISDSNNEYRTYKTIGAFKKALIGFRDRVMTRGQEHASIRCRYDIDGFDIVAMASYDVCITGTPGRQVTESFDFIRGSMTIRHTNIYLNRGGRTICDSRDDIIGWDRFGIGAVRLDPEKDNSAAVVLSDGSVVIVTDRQCIDDWEWKEMDADGLTGAMYCDGMTLRGEHIEGGEVLYGPGMTWSEAFRVMLQGTPAEGAEPMGIVDESKVYDPMGRFGDPENWTRAIVEAYGRYPLA